MIKVVRFSSGVRTCGVFSWAHITWFASVVSLAVSGNVKLVVKPEVTAQCGENVTLLCETTLPQSDIKNFIWMAKNKTCDFEPKADSDLLCESVTNGSQHRFTLTLLNVMPIKRGNYFCKIRALAGADSAKTALTVQNCNGSSDSSIDESQAKCSFNGVYPRGIVHWFHGVVNLTDSVSTEEEDEDGRYNVSSTLAIQKGNLKGDLYCSLWVPTDGKYLSRILVRAGSAGSIRLQWICILMEIMMVVFMK